MKKSMTLRSLVFSQQVLLLLLFSLVVVIIWVAASISFSYTKSTLSQNDVTSVTPLNPHLDTELFTKLQARKSWTNAQLESFTPIVEIRTSDGTVQLSNQPIIPVASAAPIASRSATKIATGSATKTATSSASFTP